MGPLIAPIFGLHVTLPMGFKSQGGSLVCTFICFHAVNLRVTSDATPAFSKNRGVHCINVYNPSSLRVLNLQSFRICFELIEPNVENFSATFFCSDSNTNFRPCFSTLAANLC